jgi:uncharacterized protein YdaU (DUF1376 family)
MPLYVADYLADTAHLGALESGAYLHLIMHYWQTGALPDDERKLARIAKMTDAQWKKSRETLSDFFKENWRHERIDRELLEARSAYERRANAGKKGGIAKSVNKQCSSKATPMPEQSSSNHNHNTDRDLGTSPKSHSAKALHALAEKFYQAYPKHVDPRDAEKAFAKAVAKGTDPEWIIARAAVFAEAHRVAGTEKQFIAAPAVWLNKGGYDSEDLPQATVPQARAGPPRSNGRGGAAHMLADLLEKRNVEREQEIIPVEAPKQLSIVSDERSDLGGDVTRLISGSFRRI